MLCSSLLAVADETQETAQLEAKAFELEQKTALAAEAKQVLDSWVRYEGQVKQRQQKELAESIIGKITKELENPRTLQQILQQSVADVESESCHAEGSMSCFSAKVFLQRSFHRKLNRQTVNITCTWASLNYLSIFPRLLDGSKP